MNTFIITICIGIIFIIDMVIDGMLYQHRQYTSIKVGDIICTKFNIAYDDMPIPVEVAEVIKVKRNNENEIESITLVDGTIITYKEFKEKGMFLYNTLKNDEDKEEWGY